MKARQQRAAMPRGLGRPLAAVDRAQLLIGARPFQKRMCAELAHLHFDAGSSFAYLQAPGGVGKTYLCFLYGEQYFPNELKILLAPTTKLVAQHRKNLIKLQQERLVGNNWAVMTWQALQAIARSGQHGPYSKPGLLIFDECHNGGSKMGARSFDNIIRQIKPRKHVLVSATNWGMNETVLGDRRFISIMSFHQAYQEQLLHPIMLNRVDVSMDLNFRIREIEQETGMGFADLSENEPDVLAGMLTYRNCQVTSDEIQDVCKRRIDTMVDLYLNSFRGRQAIIYAPNVALCAYASTQLQKVRHAIITSKRPARDTDKDIESFINGKLDVLVACRMLVEGFDYPKLELVFDCNFNPRNVRSTVQKVCRLSRLKPHRRPANYFYCVDSFTLRKAPSVRLVADNYGLHSGLTDLVPEETLFKDLVLEDRSLLAQVLDPTLLNSQQPAKVINVGSRGARVSRTYLMPMDPQVPLESQVFLQDLLDRSPDLLDPINQTMDAEDRHLYDQAEHNKANFIRMAYSGATSGWDDALFRYYTSPNSEGYDAEFTSKISNIVATKAPPPSGNHRKDIVDTIHRLIRTFSGGNSPQWRPTGETGEFLEEVLRDPFSAERLGLMDVIVEHVPQWLQGSPWNADSLSLVKRIMNGGKPASWLSYPQLAFTYETLWAATGPGSDFERFVQEHSPGWLTQEVNAWEREQGLQKLLLFMTTDGTSYAPSSDTTLGAYLREQHDQCTEFFIEMCVRRPGWFRVRKNWPNAKQARENADSLVW